MRKWKSLIWALAGGLPIVAATVWTGPGVSARWGVESAAAQTTDGSASADGNASSPDSSAPVRNGFVQRRQWMDDLRWYSMSPQDRQAVRDREEVAWNELMSFLRENARNRYDILRKHEPEFASPLRTALLQRWQNMVQVRQTQPALYDLMVQQFQAEDRLIGLAARLRRANKLGLTQLQGQLKDQIRAVAGELVELNLSQRAAQIENLRRLLDQQQADLARDTQNKNQLIEARTRRILQQADTAVRPPADNSAAAPDSQSN